jgi:hypothetical protein
MPRIRQEVEPLRVRQQPQFEPFQMGWLHRQLRPFLPFASSTVSCPSGPTAAANSGIEGALPRPRRERASPNVPCHQRIVHRSTRARLRPPPGAFGRPAPAAANSAQSREP